MEIYPSRPDTPTSSVRLGFQVPSVVAVVDALRRHSFVVSDEPHESLWGLRIVVDDPDGNRIDLTQPIEE
jgi:hypothetical protein